MNRPHFSIGIKALRERGWNVFWQHSTYRDWTRVFAEGSYTVSDWNEGSKIQFLEPTSGSDLAAVIEKKTPNEFMSFKHVAEIKTGQEHGAGARIRLAVSD